MIETLIALWCAVGLAGHLYVMETIYRRYAEWVPRDLVWWAGTLIIALPSLIGGPLILVAAFIFVRTRDWR